MTANIKDIFEKVKNNKKKVIVSVTIDAQVKDFLVNLRKKKNVKNLSPIVNEILKDWIKQSGYKFEEMEEVKKK